MGKDIDYVKIEIKDGSRLILAKEKLDLIKGEYDLWQKIIEISDKLYKGKSKKKD